MWHTSLILSLSPYSLSPHSRVRSLLALSPVAAARQRLKTIKLVLLIISPLFIKRIRFADILLENAGGRWRLAPNLPASESIWRHPNASEGIRRHSKASKCIRLLSNCIPHTSEWWFRRGGKTNRKQRFEHKFPLICCLVLGWNRMLSLFTYRSLPIWARPTSSREAPTCKVRSLASSHSVRTRFSWRALLISIEISSGCL